jgi:hypothetical protein
MNNKQQPTAWVNWCAATGKRSVSFECESELASQPLYLGMDWQGLTDEQKLCLEIQGNKSDVMLAELVESWLKEANNGQNTP